MSDLRDRTNEISRMAQSPTGKWVVTGIVVVIILGVIASAFTDWL